MLWYKGKVMMARISASPAWQPVAKPQRDRVASAAGPDAGRCDTGAVWASSRGGSEADGPAPLQSP